MNLPRPFGPYTLLRRLAVGGMAEIYVAKTRGLGGFEKLVAIKLVHPHLSADPHFVRMLIDEAKILVLLTHANIAQVFDLGCIDGTYYIAMEYVEGVDIHGLQRAAAKVAKQLPIHACCFIVAETLNGLDYAHRKRDLAGKPLNIVHRDVSPQNVLISEAGEVKLVDFGIAKTSLRGEGTEVGVIKGKYYYMSPEQAWADPMDRRSDIFSTGIVLYEMLTGRMMYGAQSIPELISKVREAEIAPPEQIRPEIPPLLSKIVMKALEREPKARYQSAVDMAESLRDFLYDSAPSFNAGRLAQFVAELREAEGKVLAAAEAARNADSTGGLRALTRQEFVRNENSVLFALADMANATRNEALPHKSRKSASLPLPSSGSIPLPSSNALPSPSATSLPLLNPSVRPAPPKLKVPIPPAANTAQPFTESVPPTEVMNIPSELRRISGWPLEEARHNDPGADEHPTEMWSGNPLRHHLGDETIVDSNAALQFANTEVLRTGGFDPLTGMRLPDDADPTGKYAARHGLAMGASLVPPSLSWPPAAPRRGQLSMGGPGGTPALVPPPGDAQSMAPIPPSPLIPDFSAQDFRSARRGIPWAQISIGVFFALLGMIAFQLVRGNKPEPQLEIVSVPNGARVRVDKLLQNGVTPLRITGLETGRSYDLRVELAGYLPWDATYHASPGAVQHIAVLKPITGELHVTSVPSGANVLLDDVPIGHTPLTVSSLAVSRRIRLRVVYAGYIEARKEIAIEESNLKPVAKFVLQPEPSAGARR